MAEPNGPRRAKYEDSQQRVGVHTRVFLQQTPHGDLVLVTMEGTDPSRAFEQMWAGNDPFTTWFVQQVQDIHGIDLQEPPPGPLPELILDSQQQLSHGQSSKASVGG
jgi:hypothetical protein